MQKARMKAILFLLAVLFAFPNFAEISSAQRATVGAYYFEGWTTPGYSYHLTPSLLNNFTERMPLWGWHDDTVAIMEQQIDLAADHGISFFAFDWYWEDNGGPINIPAIESEPINQGLQLYLQASNKNRLKFCLMIANHGGFAITGTSAWKQGADYWMKYFKDPHYMKVGGKPVLMIFNPGAGDAAAFQYLQQLAQQNGLPGIALVDLGFATSATSPLYNYYQLTGFYNNAPGWKAGSVAKDYTTLSPKLGRSGDVRLTLPLVHSGIDYRPWHNDSWYYSINHTPQVFANKLQQVITWMDNNPARVTAERVFMIYAWNEIGEGGYLMPTLGDPDGEWLDAIKSVVIGGPSDTTAPSIPTNLSATTVSSSQIDLSWTASTDNVGVVGYRVESCLGSSCINFAQIGTPTATTFSSTGLSANTIYRYRIRAIDASGNLSGYSSIASATTQSSGAAGPVAWWKFDETSGTTASDSSGSSTGILVNGPVWASGKINNALSFDGTDDYVNAGNANPSLRFTGDGTISVWVRLNSTGTMGGTIFEKQSDSNSGRYWQWGMKFGLSSGRIPYLSIVHTDGGAHQHNLYSPGAVSAGSWHHIAGVWESPNLRIYIDGSQDSALDVGAGTLRTGTQGTSYVGAFYDQTDAMTGFFSGMIDDVRIYNRALNQSEIQALYNSTFHKSDTSQDGCVSGTELNAFMDRWKFDNVDVTIRELIEAIGLWKRGGCP